MVSRERPLRIGYVNQDFPPEVGAGPARILEMALHWKRAGAEVTVVTGIPHRRLPNMADGAVHPGYRGRMFMAEEWQGLRVLRSWLYVSPKRGFVRTVANNASFMASSTLHALARAEKFDVVIASTPPFLAQLTGDAIRRARGIPMVVEIRDLWPDYLVDLGMVRSARAQRMIFGLERYLLRRAAHVVVVTESFRRRVVQKGVPAERVDVIPNGAELGRYYRADEEPPLPALRRAAGEFVVGYLGNFGAGQELRTVVRAAARLQDRAPGVRFVLAGDGKEKAAVEACAAELGVRNLQLCPPIDKEQTRAFYNACDLCLVPLAPVPIFSETVPSKLFEIMACERPVLASVAGEAAEVVARSGGGRVSPPGDDEALAAAVLEFRGMDPQLRQAMGARGREYVRGHYDREALAARYLEILHEVAARRPSALTP
jgi:glycosyltransferase involved in cell wall biosynthesis